MRSGWIVAGALLASGCATSGTKVTQAQVAEFRRGVTSYDEVIAALGRPTTATATPDGRRIAIYDYERIRVRATSFIPLFGAVVGGTDEESGWAVFHFDAADRLEQWDVTAGPTR